MMETILGATIPLLAGWIWWVDRKVASHEVIINKMDKLIDLLMERGYQDLHDRAAALEAKHGNPLR